MNDHVLKGSGLVASSVTGKLSDFAGLFAAPAALAFAFRLRSRGAVIGLHALLGVLFLALKTLSSATCAWEHAGQALGLTWRVWSDPTDLVALPMLLLSFWQIERAAALAPRQAWRRVQQVFGSALGVFACVATSRPPPRAPLLTPRVVAYEDSAHHRVHVLDRSSGRLLFSAASDEQAITLGNNVIVYADDTVRAVEVDNRGNDRWRYVEKKHVSRLDRCGNGVLVVTETSTVLLDVNSGKPRWKAGRLSNSYCTAELVLHYERGEPGSLIALDINTGKERFRELERQPFAFAQLGDSILVAIQEELHARSLSSGKLVWSRTIPKTPYSYDLQLAADTGIATVGVRECCVVAFDANGNQLWNTQGVQLLAQVGGRVFVNDGRTVQALAANSGTPLWSRSLRHSLYLTRASADAELLIVRRDDDALLAVDAANGKTVWEMSGD